MTSSMWLWCHCHESYIFLRSKTESSSVEFAPHLSKWTNQNSGQHMTSLLRDHHCRPISVLYGSNKVTIVQIFSFVTSITITSQWRHKKPKFDSRAVNIFNWLWITSFLSVIQPRLLLISVPWSSRHLNVYSLPPPVVKNVMTMMVADGAVA